MKRPDTRLLLEIVRKVHEDLPYSRRLGLKVNCLTSEEAGFTFGMKSELLSNWAQGALDDGIVSAVLGATGNLVAGAFVAAKMQAFSHDEIERRIGEIGSAEMTVRRMRPSQGSAFVSLGTIAQIHERNVTINLELRNQDGVLVAEGSATYILD